MTTERAIARRRIRQLRRIGVPQSWRRKIAKAQKWKCYYCGEQMHKKPRGTNDQKQVTLDHKTPLATGGDNRKSNLVADCRGCNSDKGNMDEQAFLEAAAE